MVVNFRIYEINQDTFMKLIKICVSCPNINLKKTINALTIFIMISQEQPYPMHGERN